MTEMKIYPDQKVEVFNSEIPTAPYYISLKLYGQVLLIQEWQWSDRLLNT